MYSDTRYFFSIIIMTKWLESQLVLRFPKVVESGTGSRFPKVVESGTGSRFSSTSLSHVMNGKVIGVTYAGYIICKELQDEVHAMPKPVDGGAGRG